MYFLKMGLLVPVPALCPIGNTVTGTPLLQACLPEPLERGIF
jgi:hypothetical protein